MPSLGWKPDVEDRRDYPARMMLPRMQVSLPRAYSVRQQMTGVRNQGNLGSCVGFACAGLKEFQERMQRPNTPFRNASEMWIYWKAKEIDVWSNEEGTSFTQKARMPAFEGHTHWQSTIVSHRGLLSNTPKLEAVHVCGDEFPPTTICGVHHP